MVSKTSEAPKEAPQQQKRGRNAPNFPTHLWDIYDLTVHVPGKLFGGVPEDPKALEAFLEARAIPRTDPAGIALATETQTEEPGRGHNVFRKNSHGLFLKSYQMKAALKDSANVLREVLQIAAFKAKLADRVFIHPEDIYLLQEVTRDGPAPMEIHQALEVIRTPMGTETRAIHVQTARGERDSIKASDFVEGATFRVELRVLADGVITEQLLRLILELAAETGIGADRSQGGGKFVGTWTLVKREA